MHSHLRSKHVGVLDSPVAASKSPVVPITGFVKQHSCPDGRQEKISSAPAKVIAENMLPISIVESQSLRDLLALLDPGYKVPCRQTMTSRLESMHRTLSSKLQDTLTATDAVAVTTDIWTSMANEAYISFTTSYVDLSWQLNSPVLSTVPIPERHTQAVIAEHLSDLASKWSITDKVVACVHDGAANIRECGGRNNWMDVNCAAHKLHLCVSASMGTDKVSNHPISKCVSAASRLVGHFAHSPMATTELMKRQSAMSPDKPQRKLIQQCKTRWNSVYDMFNRLVDLRWPVCAVLSDRTVVKLTDAKTLELRDEQWQLMSDLLPVLKPLQIATSVMSAEHKPTSSVLYPMMMGLVGDHLVASDDDSQAVATFKRSAATEIKQRFGINDTQTVKNPLVIASVLDPNYKDLTGMTSDV